MRARAFDLPAPDFFRPENAAEWSYRARPEELRQEALRWQRLHAIRPSSEDEQRTILLLVDPQKDFCLPEGSLYVRGRDGTGAVGDNQRLARFIYRNLARISEIICTLDTHLPHQIFFPSFWVDDAGEPLEAHRTIATSDVDGGAVRPNPVVAAWIGAPDPGWLESHVRFYCRELERSGRYQLYLWPLHCLLGSEGHGLAGVVDEARLFHSFTRGARSALELKGLEPLTEFYSVLAPEVESSFDGSPLWTPRGRLLERLLDADRLIIAGQAASHCVRFTLEHLRAHIAGIRGGAPGAIYVLEDCSSAVVVPGERSSSPPLADFTEAAEASLASCRSAGMRVVRSEQTMEEWS